MALDSGLHEMELRGDGLEFSAPVFQSRPSSKRTNLHHGLRERHRSPAACENTGFPPSSPAPLHFQILLQKVEDGPKELAFLESSRMGLRLSVQGTTVLRNWQTGVQHGQERLKIPVLLLALRGCRSWWKSAAARWSRTTLSPTRNFSFPPGS